MARSQNDPLDPDKIKANLKIKRIGRKIIVFNRTASTNDTAAQYAKNKKNDGMVIFAEHQTAGRGRAGARWHSSPSDSILCSILLTDSRISPELLCLTSAVAVAQAIGKIANCQAKIKWPNDIILNARKVAGILLETKTYQHGNAYIIGIGINCHQSRDSFPPELQSAATSIDIESSSVCDRICLAKRLLTTIEHWLQIAEKQPREVTKTWRRLSTLLGHPVALLFNGKKFTGHCLGLDPEKGLILQLDTGGVRLFPAAHSTIAKS